MKTEASILGRLLKAAALAPRAGVVEVPFGFETRALAAWRCRPVEDDLAFLLPILRNGLLAAGMVLLVSLVVSYSTMGRSGDDELLLVNSTYELVMK